MEDTIVAIATPPGKAGVAIVRISGEKSHDIIKKITRKTANFLSRHMYLFDIYLNEIVDNALIVFFPNPNSYTGEDVAEIQCHGGYFIAEEVCKEVIHLGARMALPGEFSKRAFLNGKMSIDQAEGIIDIINAESEAQAKAGSELLRGELSESVEKAKDKLTDIIASIEAKLDYPEYDFTDEETKNINDNMNQLKTELDKLMGTHVQGSMIKNGVKVAIVGEPNVGKSSLLNAITHSNKAIVTDVAGTTRDVVESEYTYRGIIFRLLDTAGIHDSDDKVEKIGIEKAKEVINNADIVLKLCEKGKKFNIDIPNKPTINVYTKSDLYNDVESDTNDKIYVSSLKNQNIERLKELIFDKTLTSDYKDNQLYITNIRHKESLENALKSLIQAIESFKTNTLDFVVFDLNNCWQKLGEITGQTSNEEIINRIFEKFCLGK